MTSDVVEGWLRPGLTLLREGIRYVVRSVNNPIALLTSESEELCIPLEQIPVLFRSSTFIPCCEDEVAKAKPLCEACAFRQSQWLNSSQQGYALPDFIGI